MWQAAVMWNARGQYDDIYGNSQHHCSHESVFTVSRLYSRDGRAPMCQQTPISKRSAEDAINECHKWIGYTLTEVSHDPAGFWDARLMESYTGQEKRQFITLPLKLSTASPTSWNGVVTVLACSYFLNLFDRNSSFTSSQCVLFVPSQNIYAIGFKWLINK